MERCPACQVDPCTCTFTPERLAAASLALTPEELAAIDAIRAARAFAKAPRKPDEPLH